MKVFEKCMYSAVFFLDLFDDLTKSSFKTNEAAVYRYQVVLRMISDASFDSRKGIDRGARAEGHLLVEGRGRRQ